MKDVKNILLSWNERNITMIGRILIVKSLILSQFNYFISCLPTPNNDRIKMIDDVILKFIRAYKSAQKISKEMLILDKNEGSLNLTLFQDQIVGLN